MLAHDRHKLTLVNFSEYGRVSGISERQHVFCVYVIHSNRARLHNFFFFMMDDGENGYLHSKK